MQRRLILVFLLFVMVSGCDEGTFSGTRDALRFEASVGVPWRTWTPATPLLTGTAIAIDAVDEVGSDPGPVVPNATVATSDPDGILADIVVDLDAFAATVTGVGSATITFTGARTDDVVLTAVPLLRAQLLDPVRNAALALDFVTPDALVRSPEVTSPLSLTRGARLALGVGLFGAGDVVVATNGERLGFAADGDVTITSNEQLVTVAAADVAGAQGRVMLTIDGDEAAAIDIDVRDAEDAATIEVVELRGNVVQAIVRLVDGTVLWQPPVVWELDPLLTATDQAALGTRVVGVPFDPVRTDLLLYAIDVNAPPDRTSADIIAHLGDLHATIPITIKHLPSTLDDSGTATDPETDACDPCCGCGASSTTPTWWGIAAVGSMWLRRRRRA